MRIIAIDTSTDTLVLAYKDESKDFVLTYNGINRHATMLAPLFKSFLSLACIDLNEVDAIGCGIGPGSLTGLRIGISFVQGLACAMGKKVAPVVSAVVMARNFSFHPGEIVVARKAREGYVYLACYRDDDQLLEPTVKEIESARHYVSTLQNPLIVGEAKRFFLDLAKVSLDELEQINGRILLMEVDKMIKNGSIVEPAFIQPLYLQKSIAEMNFERRRNL